MESFFLYFYHPIHTPMEVRIDLNTMKFHACHGVSRQERVVGNEFTVDVSYTFAGERLFESDDLNDTADYADIYETVKAEIERPSRLLEHAAGRILRALRKAFPRLIHIKVRLTKLNPPLGGEVHSASVTLEDVETK